MKLELMKLEVFSKGSNTIGTNRGKAEPVNGKNPWRGKFDRRRRPRNEESAVEFTAQAVKNKSK